MPIKVPSELPALKTLDREGVMVMGERDAIRQDIRPMRIGLLNLMPNKERTEIQFARLLGATPLQVELTLVRLESHTPSHTPASHMQAFYRGWSDVSDEKFDGFIVTGAPVETLPFEDVRYWDELGAILDWTQTHVHRSLTICWGAQAAMHHFYGTPKFALPEKAFGIYRHRNRAPSSPYLHGFSDDFSIPVSRWTEVRAADLPADNDLKILMDSDEVGLCLLDDPRHRMLHMFNHIEYNSDSLASEYFRDRDAGLATRMPAHYFPQDDPSRPPDNRWRSHAYLLFGNWINQIYQTTAYDIADIGRAGKGPGTHARSETPPPANDVPGAAA